MILEDVTLLAANTARSQAYIQALIKNGLLPKQVIFLGLNHSIKEYKPRHIEYWHHIFIPDLNESVLTSCENARIPVLTIDNPDVNSYEVASMLQKIQSQIVIYSGVGGQIVSDATLKLGSVFLHLHSGWLPSYRGSTTLYYAILNGEMPAVSALILDKTIDTGPVIARKHYPLPPQEINIDLFYDPAIRADLLVEIMREYAKSHQLPSQVVQPENEAHTYFVIHPLLKHLAILSLK